MELKKYKLGEILDVIRGASLSGEFYATEGEYIRLTCGNFDYQNNCFKENKSKDNLYYTGDFRSAALFRKSRPWERLYCPGPCTRAETLSTSGNSVRRISRSRLVMLMRRHLS